MALLWHNNITIFKGLLVTARDEPIESQLISRTLERSAHLTNVRATARMRVSLTRVRRPDFVIVADSTGAAATIRAIARAFPTTPLIVTTSEVSTGVSDREYRAGATAVVPLSALASAVKRIMHVHVPPKTGSRPVARFHAARGLVEELHDPVTGRLDAQRVAIALGVSISTLAKAVGLTPSALSKRGDAKAAQPALREIEFAIACLPQLLGSDARMLAWLHANHPDLGGEPPINLLTKGSAREFANYVRSALAGQPA